MEEKQHTGHSDSLVLALAVIRVTDKAGLEVVRELGLGD
jgi:hypothetical protein